MRGKLDVLLAVLILVLFFLPDLLKLAKFTVGMLFPVWRRETPREMKIRVLLEAKPT